MKRDTRGRSCKKMEESSTNTKGIRMLELTEKRSKESADLKEKRVQELIGKIKKK